MLAAVVREYGIGWRAAMEQPYALSLWLFIQWRESQEFDLVADLSARLDLAHMIAKAFHDPKQLEEDNRRLRREAGLDLSIDEVRARAEAAAQAFEQSAQFRGLTHG